MSVRSGLIKILKAVTPAVLLVHVGASDAHIVRIQVDCDTCGSDAVLVVLIVPGLRTCNRDLFRVDCLWHVRVGQLISVDGKVIALYRFFIHGVEDPASVLRILRYVLERKCPSAVRIRAFCGDFGAVHGLLAGLKVYGDAFRPDAVLIVRIVPGLGAFDGDVLLLEAFGYMPVGDHKAVFRVSCDLRLIIGNRTLGNLVDKLASVLAIALHVTERVRPDIRALFGVGIRNAHHMSRTSAAVHGQGDGQPLRPDTVRVILVVPDLGYGDVHGIGLHVLGLMFVGDHKAFGCASRNSGLVALHLALINGVDDLAAVLVVFVLIRELKRPAVRFGHKGSGRTDTVRVQVHGDALRTQSVRILLVVPDLRTGYRNLLRRYDLRLMGVGDHEAAGRAAADIHVVTVHCILIDGVHDRCTIRRRSIQIRKGTGPDITGRSGSAFRSEP